MKLNGINGIVTVTRERIRTMSLLEHEAFTVRDLMDETGLSRPSCSFRLRELEMSNLVIVTKRYCEVAPTEPHEYKLNRRGRRLLRAFRQVERLLSEGNKG